MSTGTTPVCTSPSLSCAVPSEEVVASASVLLQVGAADRGGGAAVHQRGVHADDREHQPPQPSDHVLAVWKAGETVYQAGELPVTI